MVGAGKNSSASATLGPSSASSHSAGGSGGEVTNRANSEPILPAMRVATGGTNPNATGPTNTTTAAAMTTSAGHHAQHLGGGGFKGMGGAPALVTTPEATSIMTPHAQFTGTLKQTH